MVAIFPCERPPLIAGIGRAGSNAYPAGKVGDQDKSAQQKAADNELRAEMRLRKDAL